MTSARRRAAFDGGMQAERADNSTQRSFDLPGLCRALWYATAGYEPAQNNKRKRMSKDGLCAIVTGSASGLGAATAAILAKGINGSGAKIVVNYSNSKTEAEATADLCRKAGAEVVVVQGDVARDEDCKKIAAAAAPWGGVDILVNNAGTTKHVAHDNMDGLS